MLVQRTPIVEGPACLAVGLNQGFSNLQADKAENHT